MDVRALDYPPTISQLVRRAAQQFGTREYIVDPMHRLTFADAEESSRFLAKRLVAAGVGKGTRVGMMFPQGVEFVIALLGITRIGALAVPMSTFYRGNELRNVVRHADIHTFVTPRMLLGRDQREVLEDVFPNLTAARSTRLFLEAVPYLRSVVFCGGSDRPWAASWPTLTELEDNDEVSDEMLQAVESEVTPADLMVMIHTSGVTADPKAVLHTHGVQVRHSSLLAQFYAMTDDVRTFTIMPFFWVGGLTVVLLTHLHMGAMVITVQRTDTSVALDLIEQTRPNRLIGWTLLERLTADPTYFERDLSFLPSSPQPGTPEADPGLHHGSLGMSETSGPHTLVDAAEVRKVLPEEMRGAFGRPIPNMEHRIVDSSTGTVLAQGEEGEIFVRGHNLMSGLYKKEREEVFDGDGWYRTGDAGYFRDGVLYFKGRLTEMIKTGGANVAPPEVESALLGLPGVRGAFVVGVPDPQRGEIVAAVVCPDSDVTLDTAELREQLARELSSYKVPREMIIVEYDDLPFLSSNKVNKREIASMFDADTRQ